MATSFIRLDTSFSGVVCAEFVARGQLTVVFKIMIHSYAVMRITSRGEKNDAGREQTKEEQVVEVQT